MVIVFFYLVPPPAVIETEFPNHKYVKQQHDSGNNNNDVVGDFLFSNTTFPNQNQQEQHQEFVFTIEACFQLTVTILALINFFCRYVSRNPRFLPHNNFINQWIPRNAGDSHAGWDAGECAEVILWVIHCPVNLAA